VSRDVTRTSFLAVRAPHRVCFESVCLSTLGSEKQEREPGVAPQYQTIQRHFPQERILKPRNFMANLSKSILEMLIIIIIII
jgi:hypothetical protein